MSTPTRTALRPNRRTGGRHSVRGFTLIRLLAVIAVLGTLSALAAPVLFPGHP